MEVIYSSSHQDSDCGEDMEGGKRRNTKLKRSERMGGPRLGGKVARINLRQIL